MLWKDAEVPLSLAVNKAILYAKRMANLKVPFTIVADFDILGNVQAFVLDEDMDTDFIGQDILSMLG